jgi:Domain of unknown function (DUF6484)
MKNRVLETLVEAEPSTESNDSTQASGLLDLIAEGKSSATISIGGVIVGKLGGFDDIGRPLVNFVVDTLREGIVARSVIALGENQVGSDVLLAFKRGDPGEPVIIGSLWQPHSPSQQRPIEAELDGERVVLTAKKEIILRCGKASITLTQAGKVLIQGHYLLSRSSGVNRIKGGSVQIN